MPMTSPTISLTSSTIIDFTGLAIGLALLILFSSIDFNDKIVKPATQRAKYYIAKVLFLMSNVFLYLLLIDGFTEIEILGLLGFASHSSEPATEIGVESFVRGAEPLLFSVMFFGLAANEFHVGDKMFSIYGFIIRFFSNAFRLSFRASAEITKAFERTSEKEDPRSETERLKRAVHRFHDLAAQQHWHVDEEEKSHLEDATDILEKEITDLESIRDGFLKKRVTRSDKSRIANTIDGTVKELQLIKSRR